MALIIEYEIPTWSQIYGMLMCQSEKIQADCYKPDVIVGVSRGGLVPSRILSDLLETPDIATITVEYYCGIGQKNKEPVLKQGLHTGLPDNKVLLVDDVSDCGKSLQLAKLHLYKQGAKEIKIATIYCKPGTITTPDYYEKQTSHWIVFPWEAKETITKIMQTARDKQNLDCEIAKLVNAGFPNHLAEKLINKTAGVPNAVSC